MKKYVLGFCFSKIYEDYGYKVMLVHRTDETWQKGLVNGIGGKIKDGETPREAMQREWMEETELDIVGKDRWVYLFKVGGEGWEMYVFYTLAMIPPAYFHKGKEGVYQAYTHLPHNTERTARWLYGAALDALENKALVIGFE